MGSHWTCWSTESLLWRQWIDETIVYNPASGNTHVIGPVATKILRRLEQQPSTASQLAESIASEFDVESDQEVVEHVERLVSNLEELGLVKSFTE
jgi:PqqD family protein of HPr-rel-A system